MSKEQYAAAFKAGLAAGVGAANPYAGQGMLADLWRSGYGAMLKKRVDGLAAQRETPRP